MTFSTKITAAQPPWTTELSCWESYAEHSAKLKFMPELQF